MATLFPKFLSSEEQTRLKELAAELTSKNEWALGRQGTEYKKYELKAGSELYIKFKELIDRSLSYMKADTSFVHDAYLIYYPQGSYIPPHRDPAKNNFNHQRLNAIVQHAEQGGDLLVEGEVVKLDELDGMTFFSNKSEHSVAKIERGDRLLWSVGTLQKQTPQSERLAFIIGAGEVGKRMAGAMTKSGWKCRMVTRNDEEGWKAAVDPADEVSLRILAMREDDLPAAIQKFNDFSNKHLLVLIQNGFLETILPSEILSTVTRGLIYFTSKGDFYSVLTASLFHGQFAQLIADALVKGGIDAAAVENRDRFMEHMIIKAIWNGIVGLPLHVHKITLGEYIEQHNEELKQLIHECVLACDAEFKVNVTPEEMYETFISTTKNLLWMKRSGPAYGLATRNQAIEKFGQRHNIATPVTSRLLKENQSLTAPPVLSRHGFYLWAFLWLLSDINSYYHLFATQQFKTPQMDTIPHEIFAFICSYVPPRVLGLMASCSKQMNKLVKSDAVLQYHQAALLKKWTFKRSIDKYGTVLSIYERLKRRIENQNRWKLQAQPIGYILPITEDKISTIKCKKTRLLVLSVAGKATRISMYDLETLKPLATTDTNLFRGNTAKIKWKGGDWVVFKNQQNVLFAWNINQNTVNEIQLPENTDMPGNFWSHSYFDGNETIIYLKNEQINKFERKIYNLRTKEARTIDWIQATSVYFWINWEIRTIIYEKKDGKYYMEKYSTDWKRTSSTAMEVLDCYGSVDFKITVDYIFLYYSAQTAPARAFSSFTGALVLRFPINVMEGIMRLRYSKDGMLIHEFKRNQTVVGMYSLKGNRIDHIKWVTQPYSEKSVLKMITNELALVKYGKSIAFTTPTKKTDIISGAKLTPQISKVVPNEYATWRVMDSVLSETQLILHMQSQNKQNTIVVLDYCNSVVK